MKPDSRLMICNALLDWSRLEAHLSGIHNKSSVARRSDRRCMMMSKVIVTIRSTTRKTMGAGFTVSFGFRLRPRRQINNMPILFNNPS
jgi:hypothetical protein